MRQPNIKLFAILFAVLLLLQDKHAKLTINIDENQNERNKMDAEANDVENKDVTETDTRKDRQKSKYLSRKH